MALTDEGSGGIPATMLVGPTSVGNTGYPYPVYMNGGMGGGNNGFGGDNGWWVILLIIILVAAGGWGNNGNGGGFGNQPIIVNDGNNGSVQRGFDQAAVMGGINGIQSTLCNGFSNVQQSLCNGFAGVNQTVSNGFAQAEIANNARQMANMQSMFNLQSQFADCCCENRLANCQTQNIIQNEGNMTRFADANNTRDLLTNQTANTQAILDKLCQLELDGKNDRIADLERQLTLANLNASQVAQTAEIQRGQVAEVDALYNRLQNCPVPTEPVYGRQPIFTCPQNNNCGCGCSGNF